MDYSANRTHLWTMINIQRLNPSTRTKLSKSNARPPFASVRTHDLAHPVAQIRKVNDHLFVGLGYIQAFGGKYNSAPFVLEAPPVGAFSGPDDKRSP